MLFFALIIPFGHTFKYTFQTYVHPNIVFKYLIKILFNYTIKQIHPNDLIQLLLPNTSIYSFHKNT